jgi:soluble lytic murein transglycosylase
MLRLARVLEDMDQPKTALKRLEIMTKQYPSHPAAGEAVNRAAVIARKLKQPNHARRLMKSLGARYEKHPRRIAFRWEAAWALWRAGLYSEAAEQFRALAKAAGQRRHLGQATWFERATYWRANSEFEVGKLDSAVALWRRLVLEYPLSYYSHQSFNRLMEHAPTQADTLRPFEALDRYDPRSPADLTELPLQVETPDLRLAAFLTRCGLFHDALNDLEHRAKSGRLSPDGMSLFMSLGVRLGRIQNQRAVSWFRGAVPQYPNSIYLQLWQRAYPLPFWDLIQQSAKRFQQAPLLILALIRHESRYRPNVTSRAKAVGLMQLLVATARKMADKFVPTLGRVTRRTLKKPEVNIQLGTAFLAGLGRMFQNNQALMLAAYNAGPGRTRRWWREAQAEKQTRIDVFVEEIPYRETQGYVKSVLASYGVYRYLYGKRTDRGNRTIPLSNTLPESLGEFYKVQASPEKFTSQ